MTYASVTKWSITSSKLKTYDHDPLLYKLIYEDLIEIEDQEDKRCFVIGSAFHYLMEEWLDAFLEKYYIDEWLVKEKLLNKILEHHTDWSDDQIKEAKKWLLPEVRAEYMKITSNDWKIELTPAEGRDQIGMYKSAMTQPLWDLSWHYIKEHRFEASYKDLKLSAQPDRLCFEDKDGKRYTLEEVDWLLLWKDREVQKQVISSMWLTCHIRDFKSCGDLSKFKNDMRWKPDSFTHGYLTSMSFYYTIIYILYGIEADVYIDIIETKAPYISDVLSIPRSILRQKINTIKSILDKMCKSYATDEWTCRSREERIEDSVAKFYLEHHPEYKQLSPSYIEFDM